MTSLTGNRTGFTFIEVMTAAVILAGGLALIYKALLKSLDHQQYLSTRLYATNLANDRLAFIRDYYHKFHEMPLDEFTEHHKTVLNRRPTDFRYEITFSESLDYEGLWNLELNISWSERGLPKKISRSAFLYDRVQ